jgi:transcriptional regulator with XRE-family HTH domain
MTIGKSLANNLYKRRIKKDLTAEKLSELSGVNVRQISLIENEKVMPNLRTLEKLALALDTKVFYLLKGDE